jgi:hypothetical protein
MKFRRKKKMLNVSKLFRNSYDDCYLSNLDLQNHEKETLHEAKLEIRNTLKKELPRILKDMVGHDFEPPRFYTQGSWAYKTLNAPAQASQQADLDDGCYLPLSYIQEIGKPGTATKIFFTAVEKVLLPLAEQKSWTLVTDKPTCTRLEINAKAHIDIPLYAIPDEEFKTLTKAVAMTMDMKEARGYQSWDELPATKVLLAHRDLDWIDSDPRPVKEWFDDQCKLKGDQLRHIVRYLKGYRDQVWESGGPSSILLMSAAAPLFKKYDGRDDLALEEVLRGLPKKLIAGVNNPANESESLTDRVEVEELLNIAKQYENLNAKLSAALAANDNISVCYWLRNEFGTRLPNRPDLVSVTTPDETIKLSPSIITATPLVGRTEAG